MTALTIDRDVFNKLKKSAGEDFVGELIHTYLTDAPQQIAKLHEVLAQNNADALRRVAHSIKSSSANFGAMRVVALALELEMAGKTNALDGAKDKIACLEKAYRQVEQELRQLEQE